MTVSYAEDFEYANAKLADSVVSLGEKLVYVQHVSTEGTVSYMEVGDRTRKECHLSELNLTPFKLGYLNFRGLCSYLMRTPARHYRQGLRGAVIRLTHGLSGFSITSTKELSNTVLGIYPSIEDCYEEIVCGESSGKAFSRDFAIVKGNNKKGLLNLLFKGNKVGTCGWGDRGPILTLDDGFRYLDELLMESLDAQKNL